MEVESDPRKREKADEQVHHRYIWPTIRNLIPPGERLDILDIGCGNGFLSDRLHSIGHNATGVDVSHSGIELARSAYPEVRFEIASAYDDLTYLSPSGWHVVVASEVIEHLYDPPRFLRNMRQSLRPGGCLILSTPYHGYLKNLVISLINGWDRHFTAEEVGGHIKFFSRRTLTSLLLRTGFGRPVFIHAGRFPLVWKSMVCRSEADPHYGGGQRRFA